MFSPFPDNSATLPFPNLWCSIFCPASIRLLSLALKFASVTSFEGLKVGLLTLRVVAGFEGLGDEKVLLGLFNPPANE